ncbi:Na+/H+ antiporter NhaC family protein [Gracilimonas tropica]|uniref:Na+/H+ antiporter NhaC family protein n=1 Tax=Gracilimonas tropica TaxID=454600 RepID=UPI00037F4549|nr:Na+/H+ antiporter NhaC family protein [Gracilimonas tropica]
MSNDFEGTKQKWKDPKTRRRIGVGAFIALIIAGVYAGVNEVFPEQNGHYGFWSVMPPVVAIVLAFYTREVVSSLFIGICLGGVISGKLNIVQDFLIPSVGTESFALIIIVYLWALGGLIGIWTRTGGAERFAIWASKKMVRGPQTAKFFTWMMGLIFHQGGTISTVLTGATVRPIADKHKVSHEELAYMVDSTASPAATLIPFNVWPFYVGGLVIGTLPFLETTQQSVSFFFSALPYNFYAIFAILLTLLFAWDKFPFVPGKKMRAAIKRARSCKGLDRPGSSPMAADELTKSAIPENYNSGLIDFFGPIGTLLGVAIIPYIVSRFILDMGENAVLLIAEAFILAVLVGFGIALAKGMKLQEVIDGFIDGCKGVTIGAIILALAVTLKEVADAVGTAPYVVDLVGDVIPAYLLPGLLMVLCMLIAFSTGTSWGTYAVVFPVAIPLAWAVVPDPFFITLCFSAVIGGSVFGDQCSPISDTTILSSLATGCDLMDHVQTQFPLAILAGSLAVIAYAGMVIFFV